MTEQSLKGFWLNRRSRQWGKRKFLNSEVFQIWKKLLVCFKVKTAPFYKPNKFPILSVTKRGYFTQPWLILLCLPQNHHRHHYGWMLFQQELWETSVRDGLVRNRGSGQGRKRKRRRRTNRRIMGIWRARIGNGGVSCSSEWDWKPSWIAAICSRATRPWRLPFSEPVANANGLI